MQIKTTILLLCGLLAVAAACDSPVRPDDTQSAEINLTGMWSGPASDSSGPGLMTWQITQSGSSFSGTLTMTDGGTGKSGHGSVSGTLTDARLHFSIVVPVNAFDAPYDSCSATAVGDAQVSASSIAGTYSGTNSCTGVIGSGVLTLTRAR